MVKKTKPQSTFYKDAPFTKLQEKMCGQSPDDQTLRLQAGAGEDDVIHLPSGLDRVDCERQEEEEDRMIVKFDNNDYRVNFKFLASLYCCLE